VLVAAEPPSSFRAGCRAGDGDADVLSLKSAVSLTMAT
jgi:hypothetical protein